MNRIDETLNKLKAEDRKVLSPYITAGDPNPESTVSLMHALVEAGADILEIGMPFSDPMAEGVVIQAAMERALEHKITCTQVLNMIKTFREHDKTTPVVWMGYLNTIEYYGYDKFARDAATSGVDGTILVDLPPEESMLLKEIWGREGLHAIYLCSPTTTPERMALINKYAGGYLYFVSLKGVTGSDDFDLDQVKQLYQQRKALTRLPMMVGFGIKTAKRAAEVAAFADGVIVGAGLIQAVEEASKAQQDIYQAARSIITGMRSAIDNHHR